MLATMLKALKTLSNLLLYYKVDGKNAGFNKHYKYILNIQCFLKGEHTCHSILQKLPVVSFTGHCMIKELNRT